MGESVKGGYICREDPGKQKWETVAFVVSSFNSVYDSIMLDPAMHALSVLFNI